MIIIPSSIQRTWPAPNLVNPVTKGHEIWIVSLIFLPITIICVSIRLYSRIFIRHWFGPDDALIVIALLSSMGVTVSVAIGNAKYDWNRHVWDIPFAHISPATKVLYFSRIFWGIASSCVRLSILCLYYRLVGRCQAPRRYYLFLHGVTAFTISLLLVYLFTGILPCVPISAYWTWPALPNQKCIHDETMMETAAILNTLSEFVIAVLPIIAVFRLRVDRRQRWDVISLLSLGFSVAFAGCFRTYYLFRTIGTYDLTWWGTPHWIASEVEIDLALICACAAPLRPVAGRFVSRLKGLPSGKPTRQPKKPQASTATSGTNKPSTVGFDHDDYTTWTTFTSRSIDLEGIGEDGFGYTVSITGPPKRRKKLQKRNREAGGPNEMSKGKELTSSSEAKHSKLTFKISTQTTFNVSESFQDPALGEKYSRWRTKYFRPQTGEDMELGMEQAGAALQDWSLLDDSVGVTALPERRSSSSCSGRNDHAHLESFSANISTPPFPAAHLPESQGHLFPLTQLMSARHEGSRSQSGENPLG